MVVLFLVLIIIVPLYIGARISMRDDSVPFQDNNHSQDYDFSYNSPNQSRYYEPMIEIRTSAPSSRSRYSTSYRNAVVDEKWAERREDPVLKKHGDMLNKHITLQREIDKEYSAARFENNDYSAPRMQHVVELCQEDLLLAEQYRQYLNDLRRTPTPQEKIFPTFRRLAIIYEKQKDYEGAIAVIEYANEIGFFFEEPDITFEKRLARLQGKAIKSANIRSVQKTMHDQPSEPIHEDSIDDLPPTAG